jgi:hypothetical protein
MRAGIYRRHSRSRAHVEDELAEVEKMLEQIQEGLSDEDVNPSVADLLRLMDFRRELARSKPVPMTVRWIDECRQTSEE